MLILLSGLSGCAKKIPSVASNQSPPVSWQTKQKQLAALKTFEVTGKVGYTHENKGGSASIQWQQQGDQYFIRLYGPLGSESVNIEGYPGQITLTRSNGYTASAKSPEALLHKELQWQIPVSGLQHWLKGLPAPEKLDDKPTFDDQNRLTALEQKGWKIKYLSYINLGGIDMPEKITLENGSTKLKFVFKQWDLGNAFQ